MTWFRVGGAGVPVSLKNGMNAVLNKKFGTSGQNYPPNQWPDEVNLMGPLPERTASGGIANIQDGADGVPVKNWLVTLPASLDGYSEVNGVRSGKNLYDVDGAEYNGEFYDASGNVVRYADCAVTWIKVNPSTKYSFSCTKETSQTVNVRIAWCKSDKSFISRQGLFSDNQFPMTLTTPSNCEWVQLSVNQYGAALIAQNNWSIQVEQNDTASTFEEYNGTQYTALLGRTIYGGQADIVTGEGEDENGNAFTFTPITAETELGVNNFWADEGDSDVTYRADIDLALQAVSSSRGLMMASRPVTQLVGEESDPDQVNELVENDETEQEGEDDAR